MIKDAVFTQLKQAMRDKDTLKKGVLQLVKSAIDSEAKEKGADLTEQEEITIVQREVKQTEQALEGAQQAGREDLIENEKRKLELLKAFLPTQLSEDEVISLLKEAGITEGMNMGEAMKIAKPLLLGKTDGKTMSKVVKSLI
ncbi:GatB/YqeY domain-containing protein [Kurthia massiliensis]|uniref:GatB/YqeY domain-containing protein n=1 Tax=Kurthia massiliensis TaxID=1033739 RepID=UPI000287CA03|nr:GatB/YqeY domain-containing protein [Kurthia massiliensis]